MAGRYDPKRKAQEARDASAAGMQPGGFWPYVRTGGNCVEVVGGFSFVYQPASGPPEPEGPGDKRGER